MYIYNQRVNTDNITFTEGAIEIKDKHLKDIDEYKNDIEIYNEYLKNGGKPSLNPPTPSSDA